MSKYIPQYPILRHSDLVPRAQIRVVPDDELSPLDLAELIRLREGKVGYKVLAADTPKNRENIGIKTTYFQMVAYKEGWDFDPDKYQVEFIDPKHFLLVGEGNQIRILEFEEGSQLEGLSPERRAGFVVSQENCVRMRDEETDDLSRSALRFFPG